MTRLLVQTLVAALAGVLLLGCGEQRPSESSRGAATGDTVGPIGGTVAVVPELECFQLGFACSWDEVDEDALDRSLDLLTVARELSGQGASLDDLSNDLARHPDVEWVMIDGDGLRFLPRGGRPMWIMDGAPGTLAAPAFIPPVQQAAGKTEVTRLAREDPATNPEKSALVLLPINWETGYDPDAYEAVFTVHADYCQGATHCAFDASRSRVTKRVNDFPRDASGDCIPDPGVAAAAVPSWANQGVNDCQPPRANTGSGLIDYRAFQDWENFNVIFVTTHGGQYCVGDGFRQGTLADLKAAIASGQADDISQGGTIWRRYPSTRPVHCVTALETGWYDRVSTFRPYLSRKQQLGSVRGVELVWYRKSADLCADDPVDYRADVARGNAPIVVGTDLWDDMCERTDIGTPHTAEAAFALFELVTDDFFLSEYAAGELANKVIFLNACRSLCGDPTGATCDPSKSLLANHLASGGNTAVLGWTQIVDVGPAGAVAQGFFTALLEGRTVAEAYKEVANDVPGLARAGNTGTFLSSGPTISVINPGGNANLETRGYDQKRAREIVALLNPNQGNPVTDGSRVPTLGSPGDGQSDRMDVVIQLDGIADDVDPSGWPIHVEIDGQESPRTYFVNEKPPRQGVHYYRGEVDLGFDLGRGQTSDIKVWAELPGGGITRWSYDDVALGRVCTFQLTVAGTTIRPEVGDDLSSFSMGPMQMIAIEQENTPNIVSLMVQGPAAGTGARAAVTGALEDGSSYMGEVDVTLTVNDTDFVEGSAQGTVQIITASGQQPAPFQARFSISHDPVNTEFAGSAVTGGALIGCGIS